MKQWITSKECLSGAHCQACRSRVESSSQRGEKWRQGLGERFELPDDAPNFMCPYGKPWGDDAKLSPPSPVTNIGDRFAAMLHAATGGIPCGACRAEAQRLNHLTAQQVQAEFDEIVVATIKRAKRSSRWWDRIRAKVGDAIAPDKLRQIISQCLEQAIKQCEEGFKQAD